MFISSDSFGGSWCSVCLVPHARVSVICSPVNGAESPVNNKINILGLLYIPFIVTHYFICAALRTTKMTTLSLRYTRSPNTRASKNLLDI